MIPKPCLPEIAAAWNQPGTGVRESVAVRYILAVLVLVCCRAGTAGPRGPDLTVPGAAGTPIQPGNFQGTAPFFYSAVRCT